MMNIKDKCCRWHDENYSKISKDENEILKRKN